jgi:hypothetical protein
MQLMSMSQPHAVLMLLHVSLLLLLLQVTS